MSQKLSAKVTGSSMYLHSSSTAYYIWTKQGYEKLGSDLNWGVVVIPHIAPRPAQTSRRRISSRVWWVLKMSKDWF